MALAAGAMGFFVRPARWEERLVLILAALLLIKPGIYTDVAGFVLLGGVWALQRLRPLAEAQPAV